MHRFKRFNKKNLKKWGVRGLIPDRVLNRMLAIRGFDVAFVYASALLTLEGVLWDHIILKEVHPADYMEMQRESLKNALANLNPDPARVNGRDLQAVLKKAYIISAIEEALRSPFYGAFESQRQQSLKVNVNSRPDLRVVK